MTERAVERDERTVVVENASYRWAYIFLTYGLLVIVTCRGLAYEESNWDLMGLVIAGGLVATVYQAAHKVLSRRFVWVGLATMLLAAGVGAAIAMGLVYLR